MCVAEDLIYALKGNREPRNSNHTVSRSTAWRDNLDANKAEMKREILCKMTSEHMDWRNLNEITHVGFSDTVHCILMSIRIFKTERNTTVNSEENFLCSVTQYDLYNTILINCWFYVLWNLKLG